MFPQAQYDAWMMALAEYFIKHYGYQIVAMPKTIKEIWLVNPKREHNRIIMVTSLGVDHFNLESINKHRSVLAQVYQIPLEGLNISVNQAMVPTDDYNVIVGPGTSSVSPLLADFKNINTVLKVAKDPNKAVQQAVRSLNRQGQKMRQRSARKLMPVTGVISAVCAIIYFAMAIYVQTSGIPLTAVAVMFGAYYKPLIVAGNEWFRLITAGFLHADVFHLMMNMFALNMIARVAEPVLGKRKYLSLLLLGVVSGNIFVFIRNEAVVGLGLSGGIFALMGWLVVYLFESGAFANKKLRNEIIYTLAINVMISLMPGVSFMAHLGGFVSGVFFAVVFSQHKDWALNRLVALGMSLVMVLSMGYLMKVNSFYDQVPQLDQAIVVGWKQAGFDDYAKHLINILQ